MLQLYPTGSLIYSDCDTFFFAKPTYLLDLLAHGGMVITPHWRPLHPAPYEKSFLMNFTDGLFNAGCFAVNSRGKKALDWWVEACIFTISTEKEKGLWLDQRYLDLMTIYFPEVLVCRDQSYNIANWNLHLRAEHLRCNNGKAYGVTMVHFTGFTIEQIEAGKDVILNTYYIKYKAALAEAINLLSAQYVTHYNMPNILVKT